MNHSWTAARKSALVYVATPYNMGVGFVIKPWRLIVTNAHVVHDNREVVIDNPHIDRQLVPVWFWDEWLDVAFLPAPEHHEPLPDLPLAAALPKSGSPVWAIGYTAEARCHVAQGTVTAIRRHEGGINYIQHDISLTSMFSGSPLFNAQGHLLGLNAVPFFNNAKHESFSLPTAYLIELAQWYLPHYGQSAARCAECRSFVLATEKTDEYCPKCQAPLRLPHEVPLYEAIGVGHTLEQLIEEIGHDVRLSRRGPNAWEVQHGSARIHINWHEPSGMISCEAYLCTLPHHNLEKLYTFLLRTNYQLEGLSFSVRNRKIILSLVLYDKYLNLATARQLLQQLLMQADHFDNILVERFGANWTNQP